MTHKRFIESDPVSAEAHRMIFEDDYEAFVEGMIETYTGKAPRGGWRDRIGEIDRADYL